MKEKHINFHFEDIILKKINFEIEPECPRTPELMINFRSSHDINENNTRIVAEINVDFKEEKHERIKFNASFLGFFSVKNITPAIDLSVIKDFAIRSAPSIMFPYVRETITNLTSRVGIEPIILPPINIISLINEQLKKKPTIKDRIEKSKVHPKSAPKKK